MAAGWLQVEARPETAPAVCPGVGMFDPATIDEAIRLDDFVATADSETIVETHAVENPDGAFAWFIGCGDV
jgi:hypothetical protein